MEFEQIKTTCSDSKTGIPTNNLSCKRIRNRIPGTFTTVDMITVVCERNFKELCSYTMCVSYKNCLKNNMVEKFSIILDKQLCKILELLLFLGIFVRFKIFGKQFCKNLE